jgi:hypothetical protein
MAFMFYRTYCLGLSIDCFSKKTVVLVPGKHPKPSIMFLIKADTLLSEAPIWFFILGIVLKPSIVNIRLGIKCFPGTNKPAFLT